MSLQHLTKLFNATSITTTGSYINSTPVSLRTIGHTFSLQSTFSTSPTGTLRVQFSLDDNTLGQSPTSTSWSTAASLVVSGTQSEPILYASDHNATNWVRMGFLPASGSAGTLTTVFASVND